jgi:hypothetical protein
MQRIIDILSKIVPFVLMYPKWIQIFFLAVFLQILLLVFIFFSYYLFGLSSKSKETTPTQPIPKSIKIPLTTHGKPLSFRISIMGAERCIIEWEPKEDDMSEQILQDYGVNIEKVKQGIVAMDAAILQRNPTNVSILPGEKSDVMPGPAYTLSSLGVNSTLYDSFHIYLRINEITVSLYKRGNYIQKVSPGETGIDWQSFRNAVDKSLFELYQHQYRIEFGDIKIVDYETGEWHYSISYMLRHKEDN